MKKLLLLMCSVMVFSCSSNSSEIDDSDNANKSYEYNVKRMLGVKVHAESGVVPASSWTIEQFSYTIDTLEIDLNSDPFPSFALEIEIQEYKNDIITRAPSNIKSHVKYINFINLRQNWSDNAIKEIFLLERGSSRSADFTYSESNIDLSDYPELFVDNRHTPSYFTLEIKDKVGVDLEFITSTSNYQIGEEMFYNGIKYKVISKN